MKYCKVFGVLFVSLLVFISCSDDDKPDVPGAKVVSITKEDFQQKVVGRTWKIIETTFVKCDGTVAADDIYFFGRWWSE